MGCYSFYGRSPEVVSDLPLRNSLSSPFDLPDNLQRRGVCLRLFTLTADFGQKPHPQVTAGDRTRAQPALSGGVQRTRLRSFLPTLMGLWSANPTAPANIPQPILSCEDQRRGSPGCSETCAQGKQEWIEETRQP